jgi:hypothetical protein
MQRLTERGKTGRIEHQVHVLFRYLFDKTSGDVRGLCASCVCVPAQVRPSGGAIDAARGNESSVLCSAREVAKLHLYIFWLASSSPRMVRRHLPAFRSTPRRD